MSQTTFPFPTPRSEPDQRHGKPTASAQLAVLEVLGASDRPQTTKWIAEKLHEQGRPLAVNSIGRRLGDLEAKFGLVKRYEVEGERTKWWIR